MTKLPHLPPWSAYSLNDLKEIGAGHKKKEALQQTKGQNFLPFLQRGCKNFPNFDL